jgi:oligopeptide/dipeptide ABC transporter ATP-binding protein
LWVRILPAIAPKRPLSGRAMGVLQIARWWNSAPDLPDVSKCFRRVLKASMPATTMLTLHGVVFDILVGSDVGSAVPVPEPGAARTPMILKDDVPSPINPPSGCRFHTRCPFVFDRCRSEEPELRSTEGNRWVPCHLEALPEERDPRHALVAGEAESRAEPMLE